MLTSGLREIQLRDHMLTSGLREIQLRDHMLISGLREIYTMHVVMRDKQIFN